MIRNPIGVDVTAAFAGEVVATKFCDEVHMVKVTNQSTNETVCALMRAKQLKAEEIFGVPNFAAGSAP
jgi:hypothetical protein